MLLDLMRFLAFYGRSAEASPGKNLPPQLPDSSRIVGEGLGLELGSALGGGGARSGAPHFLLGFDEPAIMPWVEIKQCPTRGKVLDESHPDRVSSTGRQCRHRNRADSRSN